MSAKWKERYELVVIPGGFEPYDDYERVRLNKLGLKVGDVVSCPIYRTRNPKFNRLAHKLGGLVAENIESFKNYSSHGALKRLQIESNTGCSEIAFMQNGVMFIQRIPESISFDNMDESQFQTVIRHIAQHIIDNYWHTCTQEDIQKMLFNISN